jgi:HK97 family phage portal protein
VGLIRSAARAFARASAGPTSGLATPERWVEDWFSGGGSTAGVQVTQDTALTYSPFFAGVRVIAEDVGSLPLHLYERLQPRGKQRATGTRLYDVLRNQANPMMSAQALRETLQGHAITWGNGVAQIVSNPRGEVEELWPLRPDRLRICTKPLSGGRFTKVYQYRDQTNGIEATLMPDEVLHVAGLGYDGIRGYPIVELAAHSIGLGLATEHHGSKVFSNGSAPGGALTHPGLLSPEARGRMAADWENIHRTISNAHRVAILEEGVTWQAVGMPNDSAQFLETRKLQVTEMARWLRLPSHKIADLERATFSNIEQQQLDYVTSALRTWLVRWEQAVYTQLLTEQERQTYYAEHLVDALLRGDTLTRYQAYAIGRQWGYLSANDIRDKENENPIEGGDSYLVPMNMVPADAPPAPAAEPARADVRRARAVRSVAARRKIAASYAGRIAAADAELLAAETKKVQALAAKHLPAPDEEARSRDLDGFVTALTAYYQGAAQDATVAAWLPLFQALAQDIARDAAEEVHHEDPIDLATWVRAYVLSHAAYRAATSIGQLRNAAEGAPDDPAAAVTERLAKWAEDRPEQTATWQTSQLPNAAAREAWKEAGVKKLTWTTTGSSDCPFCSRMDGKTVAIDKPFVHEGGEVTGLEASLQIDRDTHHPPLHPGCDCQVVPE